MRDEQDGRALGREPAHLDEEPVAGADVQGGRRLVEDENLGVAHQCAGNTEGLPLGERELARRKIQRNLACDAFQDILGYCSLLGAGQPATKHSVGPEPDVLEGRLAPRSEDFLEYRRNPQVHGSSGRTAGYGDAVQCDGAGIGPVDASHDLDESALSGAVFAQERVDFARSEVEVPVDEGAGGTEALAHPGEHQAGWLVVHGGSPWLINVVWVIFETRRIVQHVAL